MEAVLRGGNYNLVTANSGEEALRCFLREDFAAILLDVQMPGIDGFETARRMRRAEGSRKTPIIFVTAINVEDKYVQTGYEAGAVDYVFKPFDPAVLRSKVAVFADLYRMNLELLRQAELMRDVERADRERLLAELELESLRRYRNLADAIPHVVLKTDGHGQVDYCNKVWRDFTGLTMDQSTGAGWRAAIEPQDLGRLSEIWDQATRLGAAFETECRVHRASDGGWRWHLLRATPEAESGDGPTGWIVTGTDIHDRKLAEEQRASLLILEQAARMELERTEQELVRARDAAEDASRAKSQLLANMSHEIRTPLGIVLGLAEHLVDTNPSEAERSETLQTILRNGRQLSKLVDDILDISKIEAGRLELETVTFPLAEVLEDLSATVGFHAQQKGLELSVQVATDVPDLLATDPTRLRQIMTNVVGNAVKFTEKGRVSVTLSVDQTDDGRSFLRCYVEDTGTGIDQGARARLFQDFMQADSTTTRRFGGTGLGLALSRRLARLLGGDLVLEQSSPGQGSRFTFWIQVERVTPAPAPAVEASKTLQGFTGLRVLVVEDAPDNQFLIKRLLSRLDVQADFASDGKEGVDRALAGDYDAVLMDIQMPRMDGYEAVSVLRRSGYRIPIIALTAHAMKEERERCLTHGFDDHLTKPIRLPSLCASLAAVAVATVAKCDQPPPVATKVDRRAREIH